MVCARVDETEKLTRNKYPKRIINVMIIDKFCLTPTILNNHTNAAYKQPICSPLTAKRCIVPE